MAADGKNRKNKSDDDNARRANPGKKSSRGGAPRNPQTQYRLAQIPVDDARTSGRCGGSRFRPASSA